MNLKIDFLFTLQSEQTEYPSLILLIYLDIIWKIILNRFIHRWC